MQASRRRAALCRAVDAAARTLVYSCEPLERRVLLAYETPVVVLTEVVSFTTFPLDVNATTVRARLWENPNEFLWDLSLLNWNQTDGDGNGLKDDAYGWNFNATPAPGSPNFIDNAGGGHGAAFLDEDDKVPEDDIEDLIYP